MRADDRPDDLPQSHAVELARAAWGLLLLTRPGAADRLLAGPGPRPRAERTVLRVLGARHLAQAAVTAARPEPEVVLGGAALDGLHALTDLGYAASARSRVRPGLLDALVATGLGVASTLLTPVDFDADPAERAEPARLTGPPEPSRGGTRHRKLLVPALAAAAVAGAVWWRRHSSSPSQGGAGAPAPAPPGGRPRGRHLGTHIGTSGTLHYRVPDHQDPAVLVAALERSGYAATGDWTHGAHHLAIACTDLPADRERVREVLAQAHASSLEGPDIIHVPVTFEDEQPPAP